MCDSVCPYSIRASFLCLLKEVYTITQLKVVALSQSPAVWQVVTIFVGELRNLLECMAGFGDEDDNLMAVQQMAPSTRGPSFTESGLWFVVTFITKHITADKLQDEHLECLRNLQRVANRMLLLLIAQGPNQQNRRRRTRRTPAGSFR